MGLLNHVARPGVVLKEIGVSTGCVVQVGLSHSQVPGHITYAYLELFVAMRKLSIWLSISVLEDIYTMF